MTRMRHDREERGRISWAARLLAVAALLGASVAVALLVVGSLEGTAEDAEDAARERPGRTIEGCTPAEPEALRAGYYVVQPGEPGLSAVADKTCIPIERLQRLNDALDPRLVPQGACINLRRDGCRELAQG